MSAHPVSARHLAHLMARAGACVVATTSVGEALSEVRANLGHGDAFDVAVVDLPADMAEASWHLAVLAREHARFPPLVVLAPTAARAELLRAGIFRPELLSKPIKSRAVLTVLAALPGPSEATADGGAVARLH
jgi:NAD(P)-dependent dehydrogenase (short-subunit alcohol dehydrogenase family)